MNVETTVKQFIKDKFLHGRGISEIENDISLLDSGLLDSVSIFEMVTFIENQFDVQVLDTEILPENFDSVNSIVALINSKLAPA